MTQACPGTACPHYIGQGCRCLERHLPPDVAPIPAQITAPDDSERLERAAKRTNDVGHIPGVLPPGYNGIEQEST